jgi:hypothetical protein
MQGGPTNVPTKSLDDVLRCLPMWQGIACIHPSIRINYYIELGARVNKLPTSDLWDKVVHFLDHPVVRKQVVFPIVITFSSPI